MFPSGLGAGRAYGACGVRKWGGREKCSLPLRGFRGLGKFSSPLLRVRGVQGRSALTVVWKKFSLSVLRVRGGTGRGSAYDGAEWGFAPCVIRYSCRF